MNWFLGVLKKYAVFSGRAQRAEYWYFVLFYLIIMMVLAFIDAMTGTFSEESGIGLLSGVFSLATLIPTLAVSCAACTTRAAAAGGCFSRSFP